MDIIVHAGVKGMKWGVRKSKQEALNDVKEWVRIKNLKGKGNAALKKQLRAKINAIKGWNSVYKKEFDRLLKIYGKKSVKSVKKSAKRFRKSRRYSKFRKRVNKKRVRKIVAAHKAVSRVASRRVTRPASKPAPKPAPAPAPASVPARRQPTVEGRQVANGVRLMRAF